MRIELGGEGSPNPLEALPDPTLDSDLPPIVLNLPGGTTFEKLDYVGLGFTHYEVVCIGAVGGRGGDIFLGALYAYSYGGGGGGGGLHRVAGLLSEIPDSVAVTVGAAGADGSDGNGQVNGHAGLILPTDGSDGGYSAFGDICRASGGKGGKKTPIYRPASILIEWWENRVPGGDGGQGGVGDSIVAGGGGAGATSTPVFIDAPSTPDDGKYSHSIRTPAVVGTWDGDIGQGGGGGEGGTHVLDMGEEGELEGVVPGTELATSGSNGSFAFTDTSVYGPGQARKNDPIHESAIVNSKNIFPGSGGGARANSLLKYGSRATGFNPSGAVVLRLIKVS